MTIKRKTLPEVMSCCNDCGRKRYKIIQEAGAITMCYGICQICKKNKAIIPASDWSYMIGECNSLD